MYFSNIDKELKKIESELTYLFKIPFAMQQHNDPDLQLPFDVWKHIAEYASAIFMSKDVNLPDANIPD